MKVSEIKDYREVYSPLKASAHSNELNDLREGRLIAPKMFEVHLEKFCNHDCCFCDYRNAGWQRYGMKFLTDDWVTKAEDKIAGQKGKAKGRLIPNVSGMPKEVALSLPQQMKECGVKAVEITGSGEPTLYPYFLEFLEECKKHNIEEALVTHGQTFTDEHRKNMANVKWIRFSIDAFRPSTYSKIHGTPEPSYVRVIDNLEKTIKAFPDAYVGVSWVTTKDNVGEIFDAATFYKALGVKNIRFSFEYEPTGTGKLKKEEVEKAKRQINDAKKLSNDKFKVFGQVERLDAYSRPNTDFTFCGYQMFTWNIGADGLAYPCCVQIYNPEYAFGDLKTESLRDIIYGEKRRKYIDQFDVEKCHPCWLRDRNIAIETMLKPERRIDHINYV